MQNLHSMRLQILDNVRGLMILGCTLGVLQMVGCSLCGLAINRMFLRATVLDAETLDPLPDAAVTAVTMTGGEQTGSGGARRGGSVEIDPEGSFELRIESSDSGHVCTSLLSTSTITSNTVPDFPSPDAIEVTVERDGCEQRILIEMNAETVVDLAFPDGVIELIDPILVPTCPAPADTGTATGETPGSVPPQ